MIVLVKTVKNETKKAMIRDEVFYEVDAYNKKKQRIATSSIASVLSIIDGVTHQDIRVETWLEEAQKNKFWGSQ